MSKIRAARQEDLPALRRTLVAAWHATYDHLIGAERVTALTDAWHSPEALRAELADPACVFLLAEEGERILAAATARAENEAEVALSRLYLLPEIQGRGLGRRLMNAVLAPFGRRAVRLTVHSGNARGIGFYERHGFFVAGRSSNDECALVMCRPAGFPPRPVRDEDAQDLYGLLTLCFAEYRGCYTDPHGDLPDLQRPATRAADGGVEFLAVEDERGRVCACVAVDFPQPATAELHRLYVRPDMRRLGLGQALVRFVENIARGRGAQRLALWSDSRFVGAHRLYERLGFVRAAEQRELGDVSNSREYFFEKALSQGAVAETMKP
jgi:GNAT superfamily N-acetyltransferase